MKTFTWIFTLILFSLLPFSLTGQQNVSSYYNAVGFTETVPSSYVENSFTSSDILYDATTSSLLDRKGYPILGMIFITTASKDPIISNNSRTVDIYLNGEDLINARFRLLNYVEKSDNVIESFVLILTLSDMEKIPSSKDAHFFISSNRFPINEDIRDQINSILP